MILKTARPRLDALTGLRYCAAISVVLSHVAANNEYFRDTLVHGLSAIGMPLFFTLSGFLICHNYFAEFAEERPGALRRFYAARVARIYPAYVLALLLSFSFMGNFFHDLLNKPTETWYCLAFAGTLTQSWIHQPVFPGDHNPRILCQAYLGVAWSVSTEAFFYLTFPLIVPMLKRLTAPRTILLSAAGIWLTWATLDVWICRGNGFNGFADGDTFNHWLLYYSPYGRIGEFWIGCLAGRLYGLRSLQFPTLWETRRARLMIWGSLPVFVAFVWLFQKFWLFHRWHHNVGLAPICAVLIYCLARHRSLPGALLGSRPLVILGESSYCLFLLHPLFQSFYQQRAPGEGELTEWYYMTFNHLMMFTVMHLTALGLFQFFEVPLRARIRDFLNPATDRSKVPELLPNLDLAA